MVGFEEAAAAAEQDPAEAANLGRTARLPCLGRLGSTQGSRPRVPPGAWPGAAPPRAPPAEAAPEGGAEAKRPGEAG